MVSPSSFEATEYTSPCGTVRVRREDRIWYAQVRDELADGTHRWGALLALRTQGDAVPVSAWTSMDAIVAALIELGTYDPPQPAPDRPVDDDCGF